MLLNYLDVRKKSRLRTLQCKENRPICDYCLHRDLKCEWHDLQVRQAGTLIRKPTNQPVPSIPMNPQSAMPVFTMQDFRLFNHFIQAAYPHHPIGNEAIWKQAIPSIASDVICPLLFLIWPLRLISAACISSALHAGIVGFGSGQ